MNIKRLTIKIGTAVLTKEDGSANERVFSNLANDVAELMNDGVEVAIISSGAVNLGRSAPELKERRFKVESGKFNPETLREQILAAVGQPKLMAAYLSSFNKRGYNCAQVVATRADFADRQSYLNLRMVTEGLLSLGIIPIFNENDALLAGGVKIGDNDQLAMMISAMLNADRLITLTNVDGVFNRPPQDEEATRLTEISDIEKFLNECEVTGRSLSGKGGMKSKLMCAQTLTSLGIPMSIGSGLVKRPILRLLQGESGTFFPAAERKEKAAKVWMATASVPEGNIIVSTYLAETLRNRRTASILLAGIEEIHGDFSKKAVVEIRDDEETVLGRGLARFDSQDLKDRVRQYHRLSEEEKDRTKAADIIAVHYNDFIFL